MICRTSGCPPFPCHAFVQVILEKDPQNRSPRDVRKLAKLVSQVSAYRSFSPPVCEFIATYCSLLVVWDSIELPRTGAHTLPAPQLSQRWMLFRAGSAGLNQLRKAKAPGPLLALCMNHLLVHPPRS